MEFSQPDIRSLESALRGLSLRLKTAGFVYSLAHTSLVIVLMLLGLFALDFFFVLPPFLLVPLAAIGALISLYMIASRVLSLLMLPMKTSDIALLVERQNPTLKGLLVSYVELARAGDVEPGFAELIRRDLFTTLSSLTFPTVINIKRVLSWLLTSILLLGLVSAAAGRYPEYASAFIQRLLGKNVKWPGSLEFILVNNNKDKVIRVPKGSDLTVRVRVMNGAPPKVNISFWTETESATREMNRDANDSFSSDFITVLEGFSFYIYSGGSYSDTFKVVVQDPPSLSSVSFEAHYPRYLSGILGKERDTFSGRTDLEIPLYSTISVYASHDGGVDSCSMKIDLLGTVRGLQLAKLPDGRFSTSFPCDFQQAIVTFSLSDKDGMLAADPAIYKITGVKDDIPVAKFVFPDRDDEISPVCNMPVKVFSVDDYGVRVLTLQIAVNTQDAAAHDFDTGNKKEVTSEYAFDAAKFALKENDVVKLTLKARDIKDIEPFNDSIPKTISLRVVSVEMLESQFQDKILKLKQVLESFYYREKEMSDRLEQLAAGIRQGAAGWEQAIKKISYEQEGTGKAISSAHRELAGISDRVAYNRLFDEQARVRMVEVTRLLSGIAIPDGARPAMTDSAVASMFSIAKESDPAIRQGLVEVALADVKEISATLRKIILALDDWLTYEAVLSTVKKAKSNVDTLEHKLAEQAKCNECRSGRKCKVHSAE